MSLCTAGRPVSLGSREYGSNTVQEYRGATVLAPILVLLLVLVLVACTDSHIVARHGSTETTGNEDGSTNTKNLDKIGLVWTFVGDRDWKNEKIKQRR